MKYYGRIIKETVDAINKCFERDVKEITVKRLRKVLGIPSTDRSRINFMARALTRLSELGYLRFISKNSPKKYLVTEKIDYNAVKIKFGLDGD